MPLIVVIDPVKEFNKSLSAVLRGDGDVVVESATSVDQGVKLAEAKKADVVVFGPNLDAEPALAAGGRISSTSAAVLVAHTVSTELLRSAMRAGFTDAVSAEDLTYGEVASAVREALAATGRRRTGDGGSADEAATGGGALVASVLSTKGGVGKSVLATNLAVFLARDMKLSTALVDLDLQFGDVGIMLNLRPQRTIHDAVQAMDKLDAEMLKGFMVKHSSGAYALLAPVRPEDAEMVTTPRISKILELLRGMFDVVVLDTPGALDETVLTAVDGSDTVLAIATMDVASLKNTKIALQKLHQLGYDDQRVRLVLNRADSKVFLDSDQVREAIGSPISARIPSDRLVPRSVNKGVPVVMEAPRSPVAKSIGEIAVELTRTKEAAADVA